jgi:hypothetical protein
MTFREGARNGRTALRLGRDRVRTSRLNGPKAIVAAQMFPAG